MALRPKGQDKLQNGVLHVPAVQDSDLPGLMGLAALKSNKAILDFNTLTLYFCHDAAYDLDKTLPKGTDKYQLETAPSGHLVLPCCEYTRHSPRLRPGACPYASPSSHSGLGACQSNNKHTRAYGAFWGHAHSWL